MPDESPRIRIEIRPHPDKVIEVLRAHNGPVTGEVVEIVHNYGHQDVEYHKGTHKVEGGEVHVGKVGSTETARRLVGLRVAQHMDPVGAGHHNVLPRFAGRATEKEQDGVSETLKIIVAGDFAVKVV